MDRYYEVQQVSLPLRDLQLTAVTSLFTASKNIDIEPLTLNTCAKTLCFNKYPKHAFLRKERDLRLATKYEIEAPTVLEILMFYIRLVKYECTSSGECFVAEVYDFLKDVNSMGYDLCKSLIIDATLLKYKPSVLAATLVFLGFQIRFEQLLKD